MAASKSIPAIVLDVPEFITQVQKRPALYDSSLKDYRNRNLKKKLWQEVCCIMYTPSVWNELKVREQYKVAREMMKRWSSLRDCFRRELAIRKDPTPNPAKKKRKYLYFDLLLFLVPFTKVANNESYVEFENIDLEDNDQSFEGNEEEPEIIFEEKAKFSHSMYDYDDETMTIHEEENPYVSNEMITVQEEDNQMLSKIKDNNGHDDDEDFLRSLLPSIKQFSQDEKLMLRIELMKTILNFKQQLEKT